MATCNDCIHSGICKMERQPAPLSDTFTYECECIEKYCIDFKSRSRFVELPFPISEGTKLRYIFEDESGRIRAGEDWETVTRICKDGFYVSGRLDSDGTYQQGDDFYPWDAIGTEYFFTLEEAEAALKEHKEND